MNKKLSNVSKNARNTMVTIVKNENVRFSVDYMVSKRMENEKQTYTVNLPHYSSSPITNKIIFGHIYIDTDTAVGFDDFLYDYNLFTRNTTTANQSENVQSQNVTKSNIIVCVFLFTNNALFERHSGGSGGGGARRVIE